MTRDITSDAERSIIINTKEKHDIYKYNVYNILIYSNSITSMTQET